MKTPNANYTVRALADKLYFDNSSCKDLNDHLVQKGFLTKLRNEVVDNGEKVLNDLHGVIQTIARPEKSLLHVAANSYNLIENFGSDLVLLNSIFNESLISFNKNERFQLKQGHEYRRKSFDSPRHIGLGLESTKSCYLTQSILYNNTDWLKKSVPATRTLMKFLTNILYYEVRGKGLAYSVHLDLYQSKGRIDLKLHKAAQLVAAYKEVRRVFRDYLLGKALWDEALIDSAKGALIYSWTEKEESMSDLVNEADKAYLRSVDPNYNRMLTKSLARVKSKSVNSVAKQILTHFLNPDSTQTVIVCNKERISEVTKDFAKLGFHMKIHQSYEDTAL